MGKYTTPEITSWEHNHALVAKRVTDVGSDMQILPFNKSGNITYIGYGVRGLSTSDNGWLITKIDESSDPTKIQHAIGILDNKESYTYT